MTTAERILSRTSGGRVRLAHPELLRSGARSDVIRAQVAAGGPGPASSVIVKRYRGAPDRELDERASLEFLTCLNLDPPLAPRFLGGDPEARVSVMEDLGEARPLEGFLEDGDAGAAAGAVGEVARLAGRMHAATLGRGAECERRRDALGPRPGTTVTQAAAAFRRGRAAVERWFSAARAVPWQGFAGAYEAVAQGIEAPGPFLAFTHGALAPENALFTGAGVRLLDLECGGARSALYDTLLWTLSCPLPPPLIVCADAAYRRELTAACPEAADEGLYRRGRAQVVAWRTLSLLQTLSPQLLEADRQWAQGMTARQAVLWHLDRALDLLERAETLKEVTGTLERLAGRLGARWAPEWDAIFVWPAFRS